MSDAEKQFQPTAHHRRKMRQEGRFAQSREMVQAAGLLAGTLLLYFAGTRLMDATVERLQQYYSASAWTVVSEAGLANTWNFGIGLFFLGVFPILAAVFCVVAAVGLFQSGLLLLPAKVLPDGKHILPSGNLKRIFSPNTAMQLLFALLKTALLLSLGGWILSTDLRLFLQTPRTEMLVAIQTGTQTLLAMAMKLAVAFFLLSLLDYAWQYRRHEHDLKMTYRQMQEELKVTEGDPNVKSRIRQEMGTRRSPGISADRPDDNLRD